MNFADSQVCADWVAEQLPLLTAAAEKGYAWLLERGPSLGMRVEAIDLEVLWLESGCDCVLGQLGGGYDEAANRIAKDLGMSLQNRDLGVRRAWLSDHGFDLSQEQYTTVANMAWERPSVTLAHREELWTHLTDTWRSLIQRDREAAALP